MSRRLGAGLGRFRGYLIGPSLAAGVLLYSVFFYRGFKEAHLEHWVWAALLLGAVATILSREDWFVDLGFAVLGLGALEWLGQAYWQWQSRRDNDFAFENAYQSEPIWLWGAVGVIAGLTVKCVSGRLSKRHAGAEGPPG